MHNLPSPLGEPKPIRRASFEIFLEGTSNSKWRQDLQVSPILFVSLPKHQKSDPWSPIHVLVVSTHHLSSRHPSKGVPTQLWTIRSFSLNPNPPLSIIYMPWSPHFEESPSSPSSSSSSSSSPLSLFFFSLLPLLKFSHLLYQIQPPSSTFLSFFFYLPHSCLSSLPTTKFVLTFHLTKTAHTTTSKIARIEAWSKEEFIKEEEKSWNHHWEFSNSFTF